MKCLKIALIEFKITKSEGWLLHKISIAKIDKSQRCAYTLPQHIPLYGRCKT